MKELIPGGLQPDGARAILVETEEELFQVDLEGDKTILILPEIARRLGIEELEDEDRE